MHLFKDFFASQGDWKKSRTYSRLVPGWVLSVWQNGSNASVIMS